MSKKKKWVKARHRPVRILGTPIFWFMNSKLHYKGEFVKLEKDKPCLVLCNHQTAWDMVVLYMSFSRPLYFVASDDLFSEVYSKALEFVFAPIPKSKSLRDTSAIRAMKQVVNEGGSVAIFPEGNRTYSGKTEYIDPAIAKLVRFLKVPVILYNLEGGYGVMPRWGQKIAKGKYKGSVKRVIEPAEYQSMSDEELYNIIIKELFVDDTTLNICVKGKRRAEFIERVLYICPDCGLSEFTSNGNEFKCKKCGKTYHYNEDLTISGVGFESKFKYIKDWYDYQCDFINNTDFSDYKDKVVYETKDIILKEHRVRVGKKKLYSGNVLAFYDKFVFGDLEFKFDDITACTNLGRCKVGFYVDGKKYQFIDKDKKYAGIKYMHLFYRYKNLKEGNGSKYLGL